MKRSAKTLIMLLSLLLLLGGQIIMIFDQSTAGSINCSQRGAKIVGNCPKKIASHFFAFSFHPQLVLEF